MLAPTIRPGKEEDLSELLELIKELALYENALGEVNNSVEKMREDGFGIQPVFGFLVAQLNGVIIGASIHYYRYSTWKGKRLFLEDLIVHEPYRRQGVGTLLMNATIQYAQTVGCTGMTWQALDWNTPALDFYKKYAVTIDPEWVNCNLEF